MIDKKKFFIPLFFLTFFLLFLPEVGFSRAPSNENIAININFEKSPSFSVRSETWFYDNREQIKAEVVVSNISAETVSIEASDCLQFSIIDQQGNSVMSGGNNNNEFCSGFGQDQSKKNFTIESFREYYYYLNLDINALKSGKYLMKVNLGDSAVAVEKVFYIIDPQAKCLGIPEITANGIACPFNETSEAAQNLELSLEVKNGFLSTQDQGIKSAELTLKNTADKKIRLVFLDNCLSLEIQDKNKKSITSKEFSPSACATNYINLGSGFLKSNRVKIISLEAFESKKIISSSTLSNEDAHIPLPVNELKEGEYKVNIALKESGISAPTTAVKILSCPAGNTVNSEGKCTDDPQLFYQDKIGFDIDFEKIPTILDQEITAYITVRNLGESSISAEIKAPDCFTFTLYEKRELKLVPLTPLNYEKDPVLCQTQASGSLLSLSSREKKILQLKIKPEDFRPAVKDSTPRAQEFILEAKINGNIRTKLKSFSLNNFTAKGGNCGGPLNILCQGENILCKYEKAEDQYGICSEKLPDENYFLDTKGHFAEALIEKLRSDGIVEGYPHRLFKPEQPVSRAEFIKMIIKAAGHRLKTAEISSFQDVSIDDWFSSYIETAREYEIIEGYRDKNGELLNEMRPIANIMRQEAIKIIVKAFDIKQFANTPPPFTDINKDEWYYPYLFISFNSKLQLIQGYADLTFKPQDFLTRGEAAKIIAIALENKAELKKD